MNRLYILTRSASDPLNKSVVDMIFSAAAFGQSPSLVFCGDAISMLTDPGDAASMPLADLGAFGLGPVHFLNSDNPSPAPADFCLHATPISAADLRALIRSADLVQSF